MLCFAIACSYLSVGGLRLRSGQAQKKRYRWTSELT